MKAVSLTCAALWSQGSLLRGSFDEAYGAIKGRNPPCWSPTTLDVMFDYLDRVRLGLFQDGCLRIVSDTTAREGQVFYQHRKCTHQLTCIFRIALAPSLQVTPIEQLVSITCFSLSLFLKWFYYLLYGCTAYFFAVVMKTTILSFVGAASFAGQVPAQLAQTLTTDPLAPGKLIYVPYPGSTSSVAAPIAVPTLVYNCYNMPLICENVASWAKSVHPSGNGDLGQTQRLYFDPDDKHKDRRRGAACGCFHHDGCSTAVSNGKQAGVSVQTIARGGGNANALFDISWPNFKIILAGANPPRNPTTGQPTTPRLHLTSVPGRFFAEGVAFSCDEFPAATFINGGTNAKTSCALQSWQIFSGADVESINNPGTWPNTGKWPLPPGSGIRMEQDWQAQSHVYLRVGNAYGFASMKNVIG